MHVGTKAYGVGKQCTSCDNRIGCTKNVAHPYQTIRECIVSTSRITPGDVSPNIVTPVPSSTGTMNAICVAIEPLDAAGRIRDPAA
jgi:hypothetical protein